MFYINCSIWRWKTDNYINTYYIHTYYINKATGDGKDGCCVGSGCCGSRRDVKDDVVSVAVSKHPKYEKYFKELDKIKDKEKIKKRMVHDGVNETYLDKDKNALVPLAEEKVSAQMLMTKMRKEGTFSDLEITFVGMAFVIKGALDVIMKAMKTCNQIQRPTWYWTCMPWKVSKQNQLGEQLEIHLKEINDYNSQLQSAINIASYAVSLEQLENALDATKMIECIGVREFWKRRMGIDKTLAKIGDICEAFLEDIEKKLQASKTERMCLSEKISQKFDNNEVALKRFLAKAWNPNNGTS